MYRHKDCALVLSLLWLMVWMDHFKSGTQPWENWRDIPPPMPKLFQRNSWLFRKPRLSIKGLCCLVQDCFNNVWGKAEFAKVLWTSHKAVLGTSQTMMEKSIYKEIVFKYLTFFSCCSTQMLSITKGISLMLSIWHNFSPLAVHWDEGSSYMWGFVCSLNYICIVRIGLKSWFMIIDVSESDCQMQFLQHMQTCQ